MIPGVIDAQAQDREVGRIAGGNGVVGDQERLLGVVKGHSRWRIKGDGTARRAGDVDDFITVCAVLALPDEAE